MKGYVFGEPAVVAGEGKMMTTNTMVVSSSPHLGWQRLEPAVTATSHPSCSLTPHCCTPPEPDPGDHVLNTSGETLVHTYTPPVQI